MTPSRLAKLTVTAQSQYLAEIDYMAQRNPAAARKIASLIRAARQRLMDHPNMGPPGQIPGTRRMVVGAYVLTIRQHRGEPIVIDIRHGRQTDKKE